MPHLLDLAPPPGAAVYEEDPAVHAARVREIAPTCRGARLLPPALFEAGRAALERAFRAGDFRQLRAGALAAAAAIERDGRALSASLPRIGVNKVERR